MTRYRGFQVVGSKVQHFTHDLPRGGVRGGGGGRGKRQREREREREGERERGRRGGEGEREGERETEREREREERERERERRYTSTHANTSLHVCTYAACTHARVSVSCSNTSTYMHAWPALKYATVLGASSSMGSSSGPTNICIIAIPNNVNNFLCGYL